MKYHQIPVWIDERTFLSFFQFQVRQQFSHCVSLAFVHISMLFVQVLINV